MIEFVARDFIAAWDNLEMERRTMGSPDYHPVLPENVKDVAIKSLIRCVKGIERYGDDWSLVETKGRCERFKLSLQVAVGPHGKPMTTAEIVGEIQGIQDALQKEIQQRRFAFIPTGDTFFNRDKLFGEAVFKNFQSAREEITSVGNALAAGLPTAAVFHLMRTVNIASRTLARHLEIPKINEKELEFCRDEPIISEIEGAIVRKLKEIGSGTHNVEWEAANAFYSGLGKDMRYFKDVRDPMAHARKSFLEQDAMAVYRHVKEFMERLAERVSE